MTQAPATISRPKKVYQRRFHANGRLMESGTIYGTALIKTAYSHLLATARRTKPCLALPIPRQSRGDEGEWAT